MTANTPRPRRAWEDRFRSPAPEELLGSYSNEQLAQLAEAARAALRGLEGVSEAMAWHGLPWRWAWAYTHERGSSGGGGGAVPLALAYLIPDPQRPQIAVPLSAPMVERTQVAKLKRPIRDGVMNARIVGGVHWPTWEINTRTALDEVLELVVRKHRVQRGAPVAVESGA